MTLSSAAIEKLLNDLDQKERYYLVNRFLHTLSRSQLENVVEKAEDLIANITLEKETSVLFDIREINKNHYAYIKRLGQEYPNIYLGVMRFKKGKTYKITHKTKDVEKIVRGQGLEQKGLKTYLKIEFLSPEQVTRSYLFYDGTLDIPRLPQKIDVEKLNENLGENQPMILSTPEQSLSTETQYKRTVAPREDWSAIFLKKDWIVEEIGESPETSKHLKQPLENVRLSTLPEKHQLARSRPPENLYKKKIIPTQQGEKTRTEQSFVQVSKNFSAQVELYLQQWANFSQLLPNNPQWHVTAEAQKVTLSDRLSNRIIVEYERKSQRLSANSWLLHSLLEQIVSNVASSKLVTGEQKSLAQKWLLRLQNPPEDNKALLAFIFNL